MKKIITVLLCIMFVQKSYADCTSAKQSNDKACSETLIRKGLQQVDAANAALAAAQRAGASQGAGVITENAHTATAQSLASENEIIAACQSAKESCETVCQQEQMDLAGLNPTMAEQAAENLNECKNGKTADNLKEGQQISSNLGQTLLGLAGILASLGLGKGSDSTPSTLDCVSNPYGTGCNVDVAADPGGGGTLVDGTGRESTSGGYDSSALNVSDVPATGKAADPQYASGSPGLGGGGGLPMIPSSSGGGGAKARSVAEEPDGAPKINMPGGSAGGGRGGGGGATAGMAMGKAGGNPAASRTGIDGDKSLTTATADKALQVRGLASEGPAGGISSAHSLDNFQKVEKRIETERTQLSEL